MQLRVASSRSLGTGSCQRPQGDCLEKEMQHSPQSGPRVFHLLIAYLGGK